jgi:hypothetical protein
MKKTHNPEISENHLEEYVDQSCVGFTEQQDDSYNAVIQSLNEIPDGWEMARIIAKENNVGRVRFAVVAELYRSEYPDYFKLYPSSCFHKNKKYFEYYSPELIEIVLEEIQRIDYVRKNWMTLSSLSHTYGQTTAFWQQATEHYKNKYPNWFYVYRSKNIEKVCEYFHPEFVEILIRNISFKKKTHHKKSADNFIRSFRSVR